MQEGIARDRRRVFTNLLWARSRQSVRAAHTRRRKTFTLSGMTTMKTGDAPQRKCGPTRACWRRSVARCPLSNLAAEVRTAVRCFLCQAGTLLRSSAPDPEAYRVSTACIIAAFWNYVNLFITTFIKAGLEQFSILLQTGQLQRPDLALAVVAAGGHFLLIIACLAGFFRQRPRVKHWGQFLAGGALAVGYFAAIIITTGPQYTGLLKRAFRL